MHRLTGSKRHDGREPQRAPSHGTYGRAEVSVWDNPAVTGALGLAFGAATAYVQSALSARAKAGEDLRDKRLEAYPAVWLRTSNVSRHPPAEITWSELRALHLQLRSWYYTSGGLYMSDHTRDRYGDAQRVIGVYLQEHERHGADALVAEGDYDLIADFCSAFRTAMTEDLATRRQRSFLLTIQSDRWHRRRARMAEAYLDRRVPWRCSLDEMQLQSSTGPSNSAKPAP